MKKIFLSLLVGGLALTSCTSMIPESSESGTIVRDCTGTYVRFAGKGDYLVCNDWLVKDRKEGDVLTFVYAFAKDCTDKRNVPTCRLYHESKGKIQIKSVK